MSGVAAKRSSSPGPVSRSSRPPLDCTKPFRDVRTPFVNFFSNQNSHASCLFSCRRHALAHGVFFSCAKRQQPHGRFLWGGSGPISSQLWCARGPPVIAAATRISVERTEALRAVKASTHVLHQRDEELSAQNARFEAALNSMAQGLCFLDGIKNWSRATLDTSNCTASMPSA